MRVLVTGGAGYIGSHTIIELFATGHEVVVVDNLCNSSEESLKRVQQITDKSVPFFNVDCTDKDALSAVFAQTKPEAVIHFAGLKSVDESVAQPLRYYRNNIDSTLVLCDVMQDHGVRKLIFSSTAAVYGTPAELPLRETSPAGDTITNPYGRSKFIIEQILRDLKVSNPVWEITILRYFNPVGAHESGLIGEDPQGKPNNLLPYVSQVAVGARPFVHVFGNDYDTVDGTGVRDYFHVVDLAKGHVAALEHLGKSEVVGLYNLGTGRGTSVMELIHSFEKACGHEIPYRISPRRPGDIAACFANVEKASASKPASAVLNVDATQPATFTEETPAPTPQAAQPEATTKHSSRTFIFVALGLLAVLVAAVVTVKKLAQAKEARQTKKTATVVATTKKTVKKSAKKTKK